MKRQVSSPKKQLKIQQLTKDQIKFAEQIFFRKLNFDEKCMYSKQKQKLLQFWLNKCLQEKTQKSKSQYSQASVPPSYIQSNGSIKKVHLKIISPSNYDKVRSQHSVPSSYFQNDQSKKKPNVPLKIAPPIKCKQSQQYLDINEVRANRDTYQDSEESGVKQAIQWDSEIIQQGSFLSKRDKNGQKIKKQSNCQEDLIKKEELLNQLISQEAVISSQLKPLKYLAMQMHLSLDMSQSLKPHQNQQNSLCIVLDNNQEENVSKTLQSKQKPKLHHKQKIENFLDVKDLQQQQLRRCNKKLQIIIYQLKLKYEQLQQRNAYLQHQNEQLLAQKNKLNNDLREQELLCRYFGEENKKFQSQIINLRNKQIDQKLKEVYGGKKDGEVGKGNQKNGKFKLNEK